VKEWYVIGTLLTAFWGNGATEEGRTTWEEVFYGTAAECAVQAAGFAKSTEASWDSVRDKMADPAMLNYQQPLRFNKGLKHITSVRGFCVPFESERQIKDLLPEAYQGFQGERFDSAGKLEAFEWWDGKGGKKITPPDVLKGGK